VVARSPRLTIRHIDRRDRAAMLAVYSDAQAMRWVDDGQPLTEAECERWLEVTAGNYQRYGYGMCAIELHDGRIAGFCGIVHPGGQAEPEVKYALHRDHWGHGIATEAVKALLHHATAELGLTGIIATTAPENAPSHNVLRKCGLRETAPRDSDGAMIRVFVLD
jgi:RimJ/RimL family protein N-acetyltransferase